MKSISPLKLIDNNKNNDYEKLLTQTNPNINRNKNTRNNNFIKNKKILGKIRKSYSTFTSDINLEKQSKKKLEEENIDQIDMSVGFTDKIDYAKKIKEAKEIEDLQKIYEKWSGERFELLKKTKNYEDYEYEWQKLKTRTNKLFLFDDKKEDNKKYNNFNDEKKIKQGLNNLNKINKSSEKIKTKPIIINFKNQNYLFNKNKNKKNNNEEQIKDELKKMNKSFEEPSNKNVKNLKLKKLFTPKRNVINNLKSQIIKKEKTFKNNINSINKNKLSFEDKIKSIKEETSETNDETISDKIKAKVKAKSKAKSNNISSNIIEEKIGTEEKNDEKIDEKKVIDIQIKNPSDEDEKYRKKFKIRTAKRRMIITNKKNENVELKDIVKKAYLFSDKTNVKENLVEKLECALDLNKYIQNEIKINKDKNLLLPGEAVYFVENVLIRFLGYFGSELTLRKIKAYIEKVPTKPILRDITFKILCSGLAFQKIYKLVVLNEENRQKYEKNNKTYLDFLKNIKTKIANKCKISEDDIYYFGFNLENFEVFLLIYNKKIDGLEDFLSGYDLKVTSSTLLSNIILSPNVFDIKFSKNEKEWPKKNLMRGGKKYYPPYGWYGLGLKIKSKNGKKNNNSNVWLGKDNCAGEWCVAYHGVGKGNVFNKVLNIINGDLKTEEGKLFRNEKNIEETKNKYPYCGDGVYLSPNVEDAATFSDKTNLGYFNVKFQFAFMTRVNPNKIRSSGRFPVAWVLNGNSDEIRPYRLLIKLSSI